MNKWTPTIIPARKPGWEHAYVEIMDRHNQCGLIWGQSDCLIVPADLCKAMTGADPMRGLRRYSTELGAMKTLARLGFRTVEDALEMAFPPISLMLARRGDCGVLEREIDGKPWVSALIVMGDRAVGKGPNGPVVVPTLSLKRTFAIGAI